MSLHGLASSLVFEVSLYNGFALWLEPQFCDSAASITICLELNDFNPISLVFNFNFVLMLKSVKQAKHYNIL